MPSLPRRGCLAAWRGLTFHPSHFFSNLVSLSLLGSFLSCLILYVLVSTCATGSPLTGVRLFPAGGLMPWRRVPSVRCPASCRVRSLLPWPVPAFTFITPPCAFWVTSRLGYLSGGLRSTWGKFHGLKRVSFSFAPPGLAASQLNASFHQ